MAATAIPRALRTRPHEAAQMPAALAASWTGRFTAGHGEEAIKAAVTHRKGQDAK